MKSNNNSKNSFTLSSRVDSDIYEKLIGGADSKGISVNSYVNSIFKQYLIRDQFYEDMGLVPLTKRTLKKIFRALDDSTIKQIAKDVGARFHKN